MLMHMFTGAKKQLHLRNAFCKHEVFARKLCALLYDTRSPLSGIYLKLLI